MNTRSNRLKLIVRITCFVVGLATLWFGWQFWMIQGQLSPIHWITTDGGLEITHTPGKQHTYLQVNSSYSSQAERVWIKDHAGATERWIGRIVAPPPEELLKRAQLPINWSHDLPGLSRFYSDATENQRVSIKHLLIEARDTESLPEELNASLDDILNPAIFP